MLETLLHAERVNAVSGVDVLLCALGIPQEPTQTLEAVLRALSDPDRPTTRHHDQHLARLVLLEQIRNHAKHRRISHEHQKHIRLAKDDLGQQQLIRHDRRDRVVGRHQPQPLDMQSHLSLPALTHNRERMSRTTYIEHVVPRILVATTRKTTNDLWTAHCESLLSHQVRMHRTRKPLLCQPINKEMKVNLTPSGETDVKGSMP